MAFLVGFSVSWSWKHPILQIRDQTCREICNLPKLFLLINSTARIQTAKAVPPEHLIPACWIHSGIFLQQICHGRARETIGLTWVRDGQAGVDGQGTRWEKRNSGFCLCSFETADWVTGSVESCWVQKRYQTEKEEEMMRLRKCYGVGGQAEEDCRKGEVFQNLGHQGCRFCSK